MESPKGSSFKGTLEEAEGVIFRWNSTTSEDARDRMIFERDRDEVNRYLQAVDEIQRSLASSSISSFCGRVEEEENKRRGTIQIAMATLEDEFRSILLSHATALDDESLFGSSYSFSSSFTGDEDDESGDGDPVRRLDSTSSSYRSASTLREIDLVPAEAVADLRSIAKRMVVAGYGRECIQAYSNVRKPSVDASFLKLGFERLSIGDAHRLEGTALEGKVRRWIRAAKATVRVVFAGEKRLCELIFSGSEGESSCESQEVGESCFMETVKGPAITLFNFSEAISISKRAPEKLFHMLDLHDALTDLMPDIEVVFDCKAGESIRAQAAETVARLAEAARGILTEFETMVLREPSKIPVPGGTIHPLTRFVMNYINYISDYRQTMTELILSKPSTGSRYSGDLTFPAMDFPELEGKTPLEFHLVWIIVILLFNLEGKSKHYKDSSLEHLFMMNNVHYIVEKVKGSPELRKMTGDDYPRKLTAKFRQSATNYERATWVRVLYCLRDEGLHSSGGLSSGVSKTLLRERFKAFNAMFDEVHKTQATWLIPDVQLREELRISVSEKLIPAYRSFLGRFKSHIESGRHPENYIKYSVEDLETALLDFFEGYTVSQHLRRK